MLSKFVSSFPSIVSLLTLFIISMVYFSIPNSIAMFCHNYYFFFFTLCGFFAPTSASGPTLKSEWLQASSGYQDSSSILANVVLWKVSLPSAEKTMVITSIVMFRRYFSSLARSKYLSIFSLSFIFTLSSAGKAKSTRWQVLFLSFLFILFFLIMSPHYLYNFPTRSSTKIWWKLRRRKKKRMWKITRKRI